MYNFNKMETVADSMLTRVTPSNLRDLKKELNVLFRDSTCEDVIYTDNDKLFFGMSVIPLLTGVDFIEISEGKTRRFDRYVLELDSKIFDPMLKIDSKQMVALILHEVGHIVNNTAVSNELTRGINYHIGKEGVVIDYSDAVEASEILNIGLLRAIRKITSIFEKNKEEFIADEFVVKCGYGAELETVYDTIIKNRDKVNNEIDNKFIVLIWAISIHKDMRARKKTISDSLNQSGKIESSSVLSKMYSKAAAKVNDMRAKAVMEGCYADDCNKILKESKFLRDLRHMGIKNVEDDLYEYNIKMNMIDDNVEALDLLRTINIKINLIDSYVANSGNKMSDKEKERYFSIQRKYMTLRDSLVNQGSYDKKAYGLFVKYPKISRSRG